MRKLKRIASLALAGAVTVSLVMSPIAVADGGKYVTETTKDGWVKVINDNGVVLGYTEGTGVTIIEDDGYAFKDLNKNGKLDAYEDWRLDDAERAAALGELLSRDERAALMINAENRSVSNGDFPDEMKAALDKGVRSGLAPFFGGKVTTQVGYINTVQAYVEASTLGIPFEVNAEPGSLITSWPNNLAVAATFDPDVAAQEAKYSSEQYRAVGVTTINGPQIGIASEPRWSRIADSFGEDPQLAADMAAAYVNALQSTYDEEGNDLGWGDDSVAAITKHFPGDGAAEGGRESHNAYGKYNVYPGDNFDTHLIPFQATLDLEGKTGSSAAMMPSYSIGVDDSGEGLGGEYVGSNFSSYKITEVLRGDMEFDGMVLTDFGITASTPWGVEDLTTEERYCLAIEAGIDRSGGDNNYDGLMGGVALYEEAHGAEATMERLGESAQRILKIYFELGLFENPYLEKEESVAVTSSKEAEAASYEAQLKSIVMLKNKDGIIGESTGEKPTVYIPMAYTSATFSFMGSTPASWDLPVDAALASKYFNIVTDTLATELTGEPDETGRATISENDIIRASAEEIAKCDFALVMVSSPNNDGGGYDAETETYIPKSLQYRPYTANSIFVRKNSLAGDRQIVTVDALYGAQTVTNTENRSYFGQTSKITNESDLDAVLYVASACDKVVVVAKCSGPMIFSEFEDQVDAIIVNFGGVSEQAILEVVSGNYEPNGLLPVQMPANMDTVEAQYEDVPRDMECHVDSEGNTYDFAFGLNWSGVINDERVATYGVEPLSE